MKINELELFGIDDVLYAENANDFAKSLVNLVRSYCCWTPMVLPVDPDFQNTNHELEIAMEHEMVLALLNKYLYSEDAERFVPDEAILAAIVKKMYIRTACEMHSQYKIGNGAMGFFRTCKHRWLLAKVAERNDMLLSVEKFYQAMTALFVLRGFGTPEELSELVHTYTKH